MNRLNELNEARQAAEQVLSLIETAADQFKRARSWGTWDLLGGGLISGMAKRARIDDANRTLADLQTALDCLAAELADVGTTAPGGPSQTSYDYVVDLCFDNIWTDWRVQGEINRALDELTDLWDKVSAIRNRLTDEIDQLVTG